MSPPNVINISNSKFWVRDINFGKINCSYQYSPSIALQNAYSAVMGNMKRTNPWNLNLHTLQFISLVLYGYQISKPQSAVITMAVFNYIVLIVFSMTQNSWDRQLQLFHICPPNLSNFKISKYMNEYFQLISIASKIFTGLLYCHSCGCSRIYQVHMQEPTNSFREIKIYSLSFQSGRGHVYQLSSRYTVILYTALP